MKQERRNPTASAVGGVNTYQKHYDVIVVGAGACGV